MEKTMQLTKEFTAVPQGQIYPVTYLPGDECPPELEATARHFGALPAALPLREDGPTVEEYVAAGYLAANYPPQGYVSRSTAEQIAAAMATQGADTGGDGRLSIGEIREALTAKGIDFDPKAKKPELLALLEKA
jgi:hypothetical protein